MPDTAITLLCASATCLVTIPDSDFSHTCSKCGERVMIAPSGHKFLQEHPSAAIVCIECYRLKPSDRPFLAPGALEELKNIIPNTWGRRN